MSPPSGVRRVSSSSSPVIAPTSSVITPPVVELNEDQLLLLILTSTCLARREHLIECRLLVGVEAEIPLRLYPDPAPRILAPVVAVGRSPSLRPLVALGLVGRVVGGEEHLRVVGVLFPIGGV